MRRSSRLSFIVLAALAVALFASACGTQQIAVPRSDSNYKADYAAAQIFHQRCGGCHTLSYAAADGTGPNPRTYLAISGPNFNERCERPVARVLYAIENGGYSGQYMPANIVVGHQAREVARFVSKFAGHDAPVQPDSEPCQQQATGNLPATPTSGVVITQTVNTGTSPGSANDVSHANPSPNN